MEPAINADHANGWPLPEDLRSLYTLHQQLPPPPVRFRSVPGQAFLKELAIVRRSGKYSISELARELRVSTVTIRNMFKQRIIDKPIAWPREENLRDLRAALRVAQAIKPLHRRDPAFADVHAALLAVIEEGFHLADITRAVGIEPRRMRWFREDPIIDVDSLARAVHAQVPPERRRHRSRQGR